MLYDVRFTKSHTDWLWVAHVEGLLIASIEKVDSKHFVLHTLSADHDYESFAEAEAALERRLGTSYISTKEQVFELAQDTYTKEIYSLQRQLADEMSASKRQAARVQALEDRIKSYAPDAKDAEIKRLNKLLNDAMMQLHGRIHTGASDYARGFEDGRGER